MEIVQSVLSTVVSSDKLSWILGGIAGLITYLFHKAQTADNNFDLKRMFIDPNTGMESMTHLGQFVAILLTGWGFVYLVLNNRLTEMYFTLYMGAWAGAAVLGKGIAAFKDKKVDKVSEKSDTSESKGK